MFPDKSVLLLQQRPLLIRWGERTVWGPGQSRVVCAGESSFLRLLPGWTAVDLGQFSFQLNQLKHANWKEEKYKLQWVYLLMTERVILVCIEAFEWRRFFFGYCVRGEFTDMLIFSLGWVQSLTLNLFNKIEDIFHNFRYIQADPEQGSKISCSRGWPFSGWDIKKQGWDDDKRPEFLKGFVIIRAIKYSGFFFFF